MTITDLMRRMQDCGFPSVNVEFSWNGRNLPPCIEVRCTVGDGETVIEGTGRKRFHLAFTDEPNPDAMVDFGLGAMMQDAIRDFMRENAEPL